MGRKRNMYKGNGLIYLIIIILSAVVISALLFMQYWFVPASTQGYSNLPDHVYGGSNTGGPETSNEQNGGDGDDEIPAPEYLFEDMIGKNAKCSVQFPDTPKLTGNQWFFRDGDYRIDNVAEEASLFLMKKGDYFYANFIGFCIYSNQKELLEYEKSKNPDGTFYEESQENNQKTAKLQFERIGGVVECEFDVVTVSDFDAPEDCTDRTQSSKDAYDMFFGE